MNKLFRIILIFFIIIFNLSIINFAGNNKINEVIISINIKNDGAAEFTEIWNANIYLGTELYHSFEGEEKISNFEVYEDGIKYENIENWDITKSLEEKKYKCSINNNQDGIELCFGTGDYGYHVYKLTYEIKDFLIDKSEVDFNFFNFKTPPPEKIYLKIKGNFKDNAFAKLKNCEGIIEIKNGELNCVVENFKCENDLDLYLNYDGIDNSNKKEQIIKITSNKNKFLKLIEKIIITILLILIFLIIFIIIFFRKKQKLEFKPF